jgi:hypothetical protein
MSEFTLEVLRQIWNDKTGDLVEVGPDRDGLDLVELRQKIDGGEEVVRISMPSEQATLVAQAMLRCAREMREVST